MAAQVPTDSRESTPFVLPQTVEPAPTLSPPGQPSSSLPPQEITGPPPEMAGSPSEAEEEYDPFANATSERPEVPIDLEPAGEYDPYANAKGASVTDPSFLSAEQAAKVGVRGTLIGAGSIPGMFAGAEVGSKVPGPLKGPAIAGGAVFGLLAGGAAGSIASDWLQERGLSLDPEQLPPPLRPFGYFVESFSAGMTGLFTGGALALTRPTISRLTTTFTERMLRTIQQHPYRVAALETSSTFWGSAAEGGYELVRPGQPTERMLAGMAGTVVNPTMVSYLAARGLLLGYRKITQAFSESSRLSLAAKEMNRMFALSGDDPEALVLAANDWKKIADAVPGFNGTIAMLTGDPRQTQIEMALSNYDLEFQGARGLRADQSKRAILATLALLINDGSPVALRAAAELQVRRHEANIATFASIAEVKAREGAANILRDAGLETKSEVSARMYEKAFAPLEHARDLEDASWIRAYRGAETPLDSFSSIMRAYSAVRGDMSAGDTMPPAIEKAVKTYREAFDIRTRAASGEAVDPAALAKAKHDTSVGELLRVRRTFLAFARAAKQDKTDVKAQYPRYYGTMAEAVLHDLERAGRSGTIEETPFGRRGAGGKFVPDALQQYAFDEARRISKAIKKAFTYSFLGRVTDETRFGQAIPPETFARRVFASADEDIMLRMKDLEEASRFLPDRATASAEDLARVEANAKELYDAQSAFLRITADVVGRSKVDGKTDIAALRTFMSKYPEVLNRFSEVRDDLEAAASSQAQLQRWSDRISGLKRQLESRSLIANIMKVDSPVTAIEAALGSDTPISTLDGYLAIARKHGPVATRGFLAALWSTVFGEGKQASLDSAIAVLNKPIKEGLPSLRGYIESKRLMTPGQLDTLDELLKLANNVSVSMDPQRMTNEAPVESPGAIIHMVTKIFGAQVGTLAMKVGQEVLGSQGAVAHGLIAAGAGSQGAQKLVERMPAAGTLRMMIDAVSGEPIRPNAPEYSLWHEMMRRTTSVAEEKQRWLRLHAYAWQAGYLGVEDMFGEEE